MDSKQSKVQMSKIGIRTILTAGESITYQTCETVEAMYQDSINQKKTEIILDCKTVPFMDSEGLELIVRMHDELRNLGGILKIINLNGVCRDIFMSTRLNNTLFVYEDIHEAVRAGS